MLEIRGAAFRAGRARDAGPRAVPIAVLTSEGLNGGQSLRQGPRHLVSGSVEHLKFVEAFLFGAVALGLCELLPERFRITLHGC